jgi:hypothetical protein
VLGVDKGPALSSARTERLDREVDVRVVEMGRGCRDDEFPRPLAEEMGWRLARLTARNVGKVRDDQDAGDAGTPHR